METQSTWQLILKGREEADAFARSKKDEIARERFG